MRKAARVGGPNSRRLLCTGKAGSGRGRGLKFDRDSFLGTEVPAAAPAVPLRGAGRGIPMPGGRPAPPSGPAAESEAARRGAGRGVGSFSSFRGPSSPQPPPQRSRGRGGGAVASGGDIGGGAGRFADAGDDDERLPPRGRGVGLVGMSGVGMSPPRRRLPMEVAGRQRSAGRGSALQGSFERLSLSVGDDPADMAELVVPSETDTDTPLLDGHRRRASPTTAAAAGRGGSVRGGGRDGRGRGGGGESGFDGESPRRARKGRKSDGFELSGFGDDEDDGRFDDGVEDGEDSEELRALLSSADWVTKLSADEMRELHARVMDSSILLKMKPPKLRGLAKQLHASNPNMPKPRLLGDDGFVGLHPHDFEPEDARAPAGIARVSKVDSRLSHHEMHPRFFGPEHHPLSRPEDWLEELGWNDPTHSRHAQAGNERFVRFLTEMSRPRYELQRKREMLRELRKTFRTDDYLSNGGAVPTANAGGASTQR